MSALIVRQYRFDQLQFWREPAAVFFTVILPVIFLVLFASIFGSDNVELPDGRLIGGATYYVPGILALSLASATFVNLTIWLTTEREKGHLKRLRATPAPAWVLIAGKALTTLAISVLMTVLLIVMGRLFYDVAVPTNTLPGLALAVIVGSLSLSALGFAVSALVPSENAGPPVSNAIALPLYFVSGIFVPASELPDWMRSLGEALPLKPLFDALLVAFDPRTEGAGIEWGDLAVVAAWGVVGVLAALRWFRWTPRR
jgi:ABC-2 type transport system permease protein